MSCLEPMVLRDTFGQVGQERPMPTPWARNAACMSFADLVFQSTITMLASLAPITLKLCLVRKSTVMARFSFSVLRRALIVALCPSLVGGEAPTRPGAR